MVVFDTVPGSFTRLFKMGVISDVSALFYVACSPYWATAVKEKFAVGQLELWYSSNTLNVGLLKNNTGYIFIVYFVINCNIYRV